MQDSFLFFFGKKFSIDGTWKYKEADFWDSLTGVSQTVTIKLNCDMALVERSGVECPGQRSAREPDGLSIRSL